VIFDQFEPYISIPAVLRTWTIFISKKLRSEKNSRKMENKNLNVMNRINEIIQKRDENFV